MKSALPLLTVQLLAPLPPRSTVECAVQFTNRHPLELRERVLYSEDGLLLSQ